MAEWLIPLGAIVLTLLAGAAAEWRAGNVRDAALLAAIGASSALGTAAAALA